MTYQITRINPRTGFRETIWFTGPKHTVPVGWAVVK